MSSLRAQVLIKDGNELMRVEVNELGVGIGLINGRNELIKGQKEPIKGGRELIRGSNELIKGEGVN